MSFVNVLKRGDDFLNEHDRDSSIWRACSYATCLFTVGASKLVLKTFYNVKVANLEKLEAALEDSRKEDRGLLTIMNHMSVVDDPFLWAVFPWRLYRNLDDIRWGLGADNVCFKNSFFEYFFSLGQILSTKRFGTGPFQGSIDACIRLLSENRRTLQNKDSNLSISESLSNEYLLDSSFKRSRPPWVHVFPEGFVLQLFPPFSNSMRYFKWGTARLILEATEPPIIVPIFSTGFEKIAPENTAEQGIKRYLPANIGAEVNVTIGNRINDNIIEKYRDEWKDLVKKYGDPNNPYDLSHELKYGKEAEDLRSRVVADLRAHVAHIRSQQALPNEDKKFADPKWWKLYTNSEGVSDPTVKFIGKNWAVKRFQSFLNVMPEGANDEKNKG
ncbi:hypothetical protein TBLA_0C05315 [Henningerozyma blattae CBS 6284]|uniref:Tafazzin family protein n=1 Tax=Henningerozyma blattae (strain ATCC 34711 / CBS 6284 / DSM 70876 / NBRC 10599 / NRRL Y-10934 / UCD 77-7) TaxID=1071380 RepID=I2H1S6_HENB6|nr:hypothetical protein TBLA_0C05315 [Tetrapisispora blattae CBS 6284]CCH60328.1 hypothetical protein TBLA_0C05315 [Tetrapisispora blattae CBS 6284]